MSLACPWRMTTIIMHLLKQSPYYSAYTLYLHLLGVTCQKKVWRRFGVFRGDRLGERASIPTLNIVPRRLSSWSDHDQDGRYYLKATHSKFIQLITFPVDLTLLLAQQETQFHEPRRSPPGTTVHAIRSRQQQTAPYFSASQPI